MKVFLAAKSCARPASTEILLERCYYTNVRNPMDPGSHDIQGLDHIKKQSISWPVLTSGRHRNFDYPLRKYIGTFKATRIM